MKLQLQGQALRLRIDEAQLARLLGDGAIATITLFGPLPRFCLQVRLAEVSEPAISRDAEGWRLALPRSVVVAYVACLPCREALVFMLWPEASEPLRLDFEVDVRDSIHTRGAHPRAARVR